MDNRDIQARLQREGDVWLERQRANEAMRRHQRHADETEVMALAARAFAVVAVLAALVWLIQVVGQ